MVNEGNMYPTLICVWYQMMLMYIYIPNDKTPLPISHVVYTKTFTG